MISLTTLNIDWLKTVSEKNRKTDIILVEKVVRALLLLEGLAMSKLPFVFKGGTALMLLLGCVKRLSIDIDIIVKPQEEFDIQKIFTDTISKLGFNRFEKNERFSGGKIQKSHFKFYYDPIHRTSLSEDFILLDVLFENPDYDQISAWDIDSTFVIQDGKPIDVMIPTPEDILGDKLTAFAPNTTGIPYLKHGNIRAMDIIKQLYDIGCLFTIVNDIACVRKTFYTFASKESSFRNLEDNPMLVLDDVYQTALCITTRGAEGIGDFNMLRQGIKSITSYIFSEPYHIEKAIIDASKAAYLSKLIMFKNKEIERFLKPDLLKELLIEYPFNTKLNKLKKSNPEAFYYWYKIFELEILGKV